MRAFRSSLSFALLCGAVLLGAQAVTPARAGLGESVASVKTDRLSMKGQLRAAQSGAGYTVQEITAATGTVVREYISPAGVVFAVSWSGPAMPDLRQALATYFSQYVSAVKAQRAGPARAGHNHVEVREPSLVVHSGGHMRQFFGIAYVPSLVPPNVSISELQ